MFSFRVAKQSSKTKRTQPFWLRTLILKRIYTWYWWKLQCNTHFSSKQWLKPGRWKEISDKDIFLALSTYTSSKHVLNSETIGRQVSQKLWNPSWLKKLSWSLMTKICLVTGKGKFIMHSSLSCCKQLTHWKYACSDSGCIYPSILHLSTEFDTIEAVMINF